MVQIPDPDSYVSELVGAGFDRLSSIYHPNTLAHTRKVLRGSLGDLADPEYREQSLQRLRIVDV